MNLKINSDLDEDFLKTQNVMLNMPTPNNFESIYDFAKRYLNQLGFNSRFVEKLYLLGYIEGKKNSKK